MYKADIGGKFLLAIYYTYKEIINMVLAIRFGQGGKSHVGEKVPWLINFIMNVGVFINDSIMRC